MGDVCLVATLVCISLSIITPVHTGAISWDTALRRAKQILHTFPLVDGHNDLPAQYRVRADNQVETSVDLRTNIESTWPRSQTDIPRLREGKVGAVMWATWVNCSHQYRDAVRATLEQIDVTRRMIDLYDDFELVTTAKGIRRAFNRGKIGGLISIEGGHQIDSSLSALRMYYELGVRSLTLTHFCSTPWSDASPEDLNPGPGPNNGLSVWGKGLIREMNRIGMLIDLSHVSKKTSLDVLEITQAPVMFSHSNPWTLCQHHRNVQDDVLQEVAKNGGIVMVTFVTFYLGCPPSNGRLIDVKLVADHVEYVARVAGYDNVGVGSDYDGIPYTPVGLEDSSKLANLFAELITRGWSNRNLRKLAGKNFIRVFKEAEKVSQRMKRSGEALNNDLIPESDLDGTSRQCRTTEVKWPPIWPGFPLPGPSMFP